MNIEDLTFVGVGEAFDVIDNNGLLIGTIMPCAVDNTKMVCVPCGLTSKKPIINAAFQMDINDDDPYLAKCLARCGDKLCEYHNSAAFLTKIFEA